MLIKSFPSLLGLPVRMSHITCWWDKCFYEGDECPRKYSHSAKPLGNWKGSRKAQWDWHSSTRVSFAIILLSSCDLGHMEADPCCSHYLKFQIFFRLLGYNTEHLIPLSAPLVIVWLGESFSIFFHFSFSYFVYSIILLVQWPLWVTAV